MNRTTQNLQIPRSYLDNIVDAFVNIPGAALFAAGNVHLFVNNLTPTYESVLGDFTEATFAGYAAAPLNSLSTPVNPPGNRKAVIQTLEFLAGAIVGAETAYGYYITDGADAVLWAMERFVSPVTFTNPGDYLALDIVLALTSPLVSGY